MVNGKEGGGLVGRPLGHKDFREAPRQPGHLPSMGSIGSVARPSGHWQCSKGTGCAVVMGKRVEAL